MRGTFKRHHVATGEREKFRLQIRTSEVFWWTPDTHRCADPWRQMLMLVLGVIKGLASSSGLYLERLFKSSISHPLKGIHGLRVENGDVSGCNHFLNWLGQNQSMLVAELRFKGAIFVGRELAPYFIADASRADKNKLHICSWVCWCALKQINERFHYFGSPDSKGSQSLPVSVEVIARTCVYLHLHAPIPEKQTTQAKKKKVYPLLSDPEVLMCSFFVFLLLKFC